MSSDLGLTPSNDGNVIRLAFPPLTEERRRDLIRDRPPARRGGPGRRPQRPAPPKETLERLAHDDEISEDDLRRSEKELQRHTDHFVAEIDRLLEHKEHELGEV